jgi:tetratricopeptide (TPR) repeat protein
MKEKNSDDKKINNKVTKNAFIQKLENSILIKFNITLIIIIAVVALILIYYGIASLANFVENYDLATNLISNYTEANLNKMILEVENGNLNNANKLANSILENNENISICYEVEASFYLKNNKFDEALENQRKAISLNKYNIDLYNNYVLYLSKAIQTNILSEDYEYANKYIEEVFNVENMLEELKNNTSKYAEYFVDSPTFELSEDIKEYIETLK